MNSLYCHGGKLLPSLFWLLLGFALLWMWRPAHGQDAKGNITPLEIGDQVPSFTIEGMINHQTSSITIDEYRGKALILDFWATWCGPCITMIPRLDSLQKQFSNQLVILPVTYQSKNEVLAFNEKYHLRSGLRITAPAVTGDSVLKKYFPHTTIPHYIWIDSSGVVSAITGPQDMTAEKIRRFLETGRSDLSQKRDVPSMGYLSGKSSLLEFLRDKPGNTFAKFSSHSFFAPYIAGLGGGEMRVKMAEDSSQWRITFTNSSMLTLYRYAFGEGRRFFSSNAVAVEVSDSSRFFRKKEKVTVLDWIEQNTYCYELMVPAQLAKRGFSIFREALAMQLWEYEAKIEERSQSVLALVRTSESELLKSTAAQYSESYDGFNYQLRRGLLSSFVIGLNAKFLQGSPVQIIDQTGYNEFIDLDIAGNMSNVDELNKQLTKYGLVLSEKTAPVDVLVIKDRVTKKLITP